jgi:hypothetical protein
VESLQNFLLYILLYSNTFFIVSNLRLNLEDTSITKLIPCAKQGKSANVIYHFSCKQSDTFVVGGRLSVIVTNQQTVGNELQKAP